MGASQSEGSASHHPSAGYNSSAPMVHFDYSQNRYVASNPTLIPDVRAHLANWRRFQKATKTWPVLSIATFLLRFVIIVAAVIALLWYGDRQAWTKNEYLLTSFGLLPIALLWFLLERVAWNHDLRRKGIASNSEVWGIDQFPRKWNTYCVLAVLIDETSRIIRSPVSRPCRCPILPLARTCWFASFSSFSVFG
jgi:hypothetical protein